MNTTTRIVFTGMGAVCAAGLTVDELWTRVVSGQSAIGPLRRWDASRWPVQVAAELTGVDNRTLVEDRKLHKSISRTDMLGIYAAGAAIKHSGLTAYRDAMKPEAVVHFNDRTGVFAGSGGGTYNSNYDFLPLLTEAKGELPAFGRELGNVVNPMWLLKNLPNNVLCHVGIRHGFKGVNACVTNQCVSGSQALAEAAWALREGEADRAVAVGHDTPIDAETILRYHRVGLLAPDTIRPFDAKRAGTVLGEGAAAVTIETLQEAQARGAQILGEYLGFGCVTEGSGILEIRPDGDGVARAIELALADARLQPADVGMIVAHGNGTQSSDASEALGIRRVFGTHPPPVTAFKWAFGHCIAASGMLDLVMALRALSERVVPAVATIETLDPACRPLPVFAHAQAPRSGIALVICRGFAGMNAALLVGEVPCVLD